MKQILLATNNKHKAEEISALLSPLGFEVFSLFNFPNVPKTIEDQPTLEGNALKKAKEAFQSTGIFSLADDTGLEVYALGMEPGVYSARYAGENVTYADNNKKLLSVMNGVPQRRRGARFRTVIAIVGKNIETTVEGIIEGEILENERGTNGFGYDPLFLPKGFTRAYAELSLEEKNQISHRARAMQQAAEFLKKNFKI